MLINVKTHFIALKVVSFLLSLLLQADWVLIIIIKIFIVLIVIIITTTVICTINLDNLLWELKGFELSSQMEYWYEKKQISSAKRENWMILSVIMETKIGILRNF